MTEHEAYVADPEEPRPRPRLFRAQPQLVVAMIVLLAASLASLVLHDRGEQDPSLEAPDSAATAPAEDP